MRVSDLIADFINEMLKSDGGVVEIQRSELADRFNCVPSQINYVIQTRFSPEQGFFVESRRGGGGFIRITRARLDASQMMMHAVNAIGAEIDAQSAQALISNLFLAGAIEESPARVLSAVMSEGALSKAPPELRQMIRARLLKTALVSLT